MAIVFLALPTFLQIYPKFLEPKPETRPEGQIGWPLYFVGYAFVNNRKFGLPLYVWFIDGCRPAFDSIHTKLLALNYPSPDRAERSASGDEAGRG